MMKQTTKSKKPAVGGLTRFGTYGFLSMILATQVAELQTGQKKRIRRTRD